MNQNNTTRKIRHGGWIFRPYRFDRERINRFFNEEMEEELDKSQEENIIELYEQKHPGMDHERL